MPLLRRVAGPVEGGAAVVDVRRGVRGLLAVNAPLVLRMRRSTMDRRAASPTTLTNSGPSGTAAGSALDWWLASGCLESDTRQCNVLLHQVATSGPRGGGLSRWRGCGKPTPSCGCSCRRRSAAGRPAPQAARSRLPWRRSLRGMCWKVLPEFSPRREPRAGRSLRDITHV